MLQVIHNNYTSFTNLFTIHSDFIHKHVELSLVESDIILIFWVYKYFQLLFNTVHLISFIFCTVYISFSF